MDDSTVMHEPGHEYSWNLFSKLQVLAITSGKGGVGKTNVVTNLAAALGRAGKRVVVLDADISLGNVDVLLGLVPEFTLEHVLAGEKHLVDILLPGPSGVGILPAGSGLAQLTSLDTDQQVSLQEEFNHLSVSMDYLLIDTGAGISSNVMFFSSAAKEILVVATPEPTSLTDAYALMKILSLHYGETRFRLVVNYARSNHEGAEVHRKLCRVSDRFLHISIDYVGWIPFDDYLPLAVCHQRAVVEQFPFAPSSRAFSKLAHTVEGWDLSGIPKGGVQFFWQRHIAPA